MADTPIEHVLLLAGVLFSLGLFGALIRRNLLFVLLSVEIMLNAAAFAFVAVATRLAQIDGQIMFIMILTMAAAEVCVGLAIVMRYDEQFGTLDTDAASNMRG